MIRYRSALSSDAEEMVRLDRLCFPVGVAYSRRMFDQLLEWFGGLSFVAQQEDAFTGFAVGAMETERTGRIITIDVDPSARRKGIGSELMRRVEKALSDEGATAVFLEVSESNRGAVEFYQHLGYQMDARVEDYYGPGGHAWIMVKQMGIDSVWKTEDRQRRQGDLKKY